MCVQLPVEEYTLRADLIIQLIVFFVSRAKKATRKGDVINIYRALHHRLAPKKKEKGRLVGSSYSILIVIPFKHGAASV